MTPLSRPTMGAALATLVLLGACGSGGPARAPDSGSGSGTNDPTMSPAADLRTKLDLLLQEHVVLAAKATGSLLERRSQESAAYGRALNDNGTAISDMLRPTAGDDVRSLFNRIWSEHDGCFLEYARAAAAGDATGERSATEKLSRRFVPQFSQLMSGPTHMPIAVITRQATEHVQEIIAIVDAQAATRWASVYTNIRLAYAHLQRLGDAISSGIVQTQPAKYPGDPESRGVSFRVGLDGLLQEHLYLASSVSEAALSGRTDEFDAARAKLSSNGADLGSAIDGLYGDQAAAQFDRLWSAHNGFFVEYAKAVGASDPVARQRALDDLNNNYIKPLAAFLAGITGSPTGTMETLLADHVTNTAAVIDAQRAALIAMGYEAVVTRETSAAHHMEMIGDPLAAAIVARLPSRFR